MHFTLKNKGSDPWKLCSRLSETLILNKIAVFVSDTKNHPEIFQIHQKSLKFRSQDQEKTFLNNMSENTTLFLSSENHQTRDPKREPKSIKIQCWTHLGPPRAPQEHPKSSQDVSKTPPRRNCGHFLNQFGYILDQNPDTYPKICRTENIKKSTKHSTTEDKNMKRNSTLHPWSLRRRSFVLGWRDSRRDYKD